MICKRSLIMFFFAVNVLVCPFIYGMQQDAAAINTKTIAISFDLDDVITGKEKVGFNDFIPLIGMFCQSPMLATAVWPANQRAIMAHVGKLAGEQKYNGSTNIIHGVIEYLDNNGYGDVSSYESEINRRTQKPYPVKRMIANVKALKDLGYKIVGATNQDFMQYQVYRDYLKSEHNIDLGSIFDAVVTTPVYHVDKPAGDDLAYRLDANDHIYVTRKHEDVKPAPNYFHAVRHVVQKINPDAQTIIHTDDRQENIAGAQQAGFNGLHFKLSAESVRKTSPAELEETINTWERELQTAHGILLAQAGS